MFHQPFFYSPPRSNSGREQRLFPNEDAGFDTPTTNRPTNPHRMSPPRRFWTPEKDRFGLDKVSQQSHSLLIEDQSTSWFSFHEKRTDPATKLWEKYQEGNSKSTTMEASKCHNADDDTVVTSNTCLTGSPESSYVDGGEETIDFSLEDIDEDLGDTDERKSENDSDDRSKKSPMSPFWIQEVSATKTTTTTTTTTHTMTTTAMAHNIAGTPTKSFGPLESPGSREVVPQTQSTLSSCLCCPSKDQRLEQLEIELSHMNKLVTKLCSLLADKVRQQTEDKKLDQSTESQNSPPKISSLPITVVGDRCPRSKHQRILVNGQWGNYSGPSIVSGEQDYEHKAGIWQGCVLRFDNGDLYVGSLSRNDTGSLTLYPPGTLYDRNRRPKRRLR